jgi:hypothetical protein
LQHGTRRSPTHHRESVHLNKGNYEPASQQQSFTLRATRLVDRSRKKFFLPLEEEEEECRAGGEAKTMRKAERRFMKNTSEAQTCGGREHAEETPRSSLNANGETQQMCVNELNFYFRRKRSEMRKNSFRASLFIGAKLAGPADKNSASVSTTTRALESRCSVRMERERKSSSPAGRHGQLSSGANITKRWRIGLC